MGRGGNCGTTMLGPVLSSGHRAMNRDHFYLLIFTCWEYSGMEYKGGAT